ncbi:hypothetical protein OUZ56_022421 [Daphnia magna]|uniref:Uncharacterized protein n=1 Tax=Daphnia magna TaxID=35525 RepID=A0ABR0AWL8_9CRUS|nr:hypothetical protein OUZ56_022421 [Daphnia magna]
MGTSKRGHTTLWSRVEEHEDVLRSQFEERERELVELNRLTAHRLAQAESKFAAQQATVTELQSELFDAKAGAEVISHAKLDEIEILMQDLDRANQVGNSKTA